MAFLVFALSLALLVAGLAGGYMSLDLLPTSAGVLYAIGGTVAVCIAILTLALGVMIRRIDALAALVRQQPDAYTLAPVEPSFMTPAAHVESVERGDDAQDMGAEESAEPEDEPAKP